MDDLISRKAAIDVFKRELTTGESNGKYVTTCCAIGYKGVKQILESIPSAPPEIIRCKDCKWFRKEYGWNCIEYTVCGISPTYHPIRREDDFCSYAERRTDETD